MATGTLFGGRLYAGMLWDGALWAWGNKWGGWTAEIEDVLVYYGGGRATNGEREPQPDTLSDEIVRQQWDLLETRLRSRDDRQPQAESAPSQTKAARSAESAPATDMHLPMPVLHGATPEEVQPDSAEVGAIAAKIEARNRRNNAALLLIMSQV